MKFSAILHNKTFKKGLIIQDAELLYPCGRISRIFIAIYLREIRDKSMGSGTELARENQLIAWCCSSKLYGEELQANGLQAVSRSKPFQAHCLLDPVLCLDDLLYLTALVAFFLTPTPRGNFQRSYLNDVGILSVLTKIAVETALKRS